MAAPIEAGSALVELLPRVVHDAPAAVLLVDLSPDRGGRPVAGEPVTSARDSGVVLRGPLWVTGFPLTGAPGMSDRALVVFFTMAAAAEGHHRSRTCCPACATGRCRSPRRT